MPVVDVGSGQTGEPELWVQQPAVRRAIRARVALAGAVAVGFASIVVLVAVAGRGARVADQGPAWDWSGLLGGAFPGPLTAGEGAVEVAAVAVLVLSWAMLLTVGRALRVRTVAGIGFLWSLPLVMGPPGFSLDAYSYVAQGRLAAGGLDPYRRSPSALGSGSWLHAVDPFWRQSVSPYGPLTTLVERVVASPGSPTTAIVVLHVVAWLSLLLMCVVVAAAVPGPRRALTLVLIALNPLVLLQLLGAAHWEALMVVLLAGGLWSWQQGRPLTALALTAAAAAVKLPAGFAVAVVLVLHLSATRPRQRPQALLLVAGAITGPWLAVSVLVPDPLGFVAGLASPLTGRTLYAPTTLLAEALAGACHLASVPVPFLALLSACRVGGLLVAASLSAWLLITARRRPAATTVGLALLAVAALGPVLYPWYFSWGLVPLAMAHPRQRRLIATLTAMACFTALPGCTALGLFLLSHATLSLTAAGSLLAAVGSGIALHAAARRTPLSYVDLSSAIYPVGAAVNADVHVSTDGGDVRG